MDGIAETLIHQEEMFSIQSPTAKLDSESDSELGELEKMRETEFVGDIDAATGKMSSTRKKTQRETGL